ncbi:hypothetical protein FisN_7Lh382 [Fistulifera solaris]|uniref:Uncharacterized protein n=1 Tax=Fistulifera solaris TaxID=1519565 RepID=A0A1Z5JBA7_FISSO|nr:hypothetical protein FisN_7Lh382 [Fistulifera solaris]|eukprot:GAX11280.1 hypothetical protein FisN_7Lh382 [Fistulifera solaris]
MFRLLRSSSLRDIIFYPAILDDSHDETESSSTSEDSSFSNSNSTVVTFGRVYVKHVHETDQVDWLLSCSVDDYELNKMHHARERRKAAIEVNRGTLTMEQFPELSSVEAYKFMAQTNSLAFEKKQRRRLEQERMQENAKKESFFWFFSAS